MIQIGLPRPPLMAYLIIRALNLPSITPKPYEGTLCIPSKGALHIPYALMAFMTLAPAPRRSRALGLKGQESRLEVSGSGSVRTLR